MYQTLRNKVTTSLKEVKRYSKVIQENENDSEKLWKAFRSILGNSVGSSQIKSFEIDGEDVMSCVQSKYLPNVQLSLNPLLPNCTRPEPRPEPGSVQTVSPSFPQTANQSEIQFKLSSVTEDFIWKQVKVLINSKRSSGLSVISTRLVKHGVKALAQPLTWLMNRTINEGIIPSGWKHAVVPQSTKLAPKQTLQTFDQFQCFLFFQRCAVYWRLYNYLQENKLLSLFQSGFHPQHSTLTVLTHVMNTLLKNTDEQLWPGLMFLAFSKVFIL